MSEGMSGGLPGVATSVCAFVGHCGDGPVNTPQPVFNRAHYESLFGVLDGGEMGYAVASFFDNGGEPAWVVRVSGPSSDDGLVLIGDSEAGTGLYALDSIDLLNLLCLPDLRRLSAPPISPRRRRRPPIARAGALS